MENIFVVFFIFDENALQSSGHATEVSLRVTLDFMMSVAFNCTWQLS